MATHVSIDERLLEQAWKVGGHKSKKATVNEALREYIQRRKQAEILELFGKIEFDPSFDFRQQRNRR